MPLTDEQAKLGQELVQASREFGGYLGDVLGDLPKDLVGLLAGDPIKLMRAKRLAEGWDNVKKILNDRGVPNPEPPSLKLALPILSAMADESSKDLKELWERLLAAAMDPKRENLVRQSLISVVKQMDPFDVLILRAVYENAGATWYQNGRDVLASKFRCPIEDVLVSFQNLERLNCLNFVREPKIDPYLSPLGKLLMRAVA